MTMDILANGTQLAGYRIDSMIGRGGMAVVYKAEDLRLDRKVALKLLAPELMQHESFRQRFIRESRIAASIDHPNIIPIYEAGETDDVLFIAMRYVEGSDFHELIVRERPLDPARSLRIFAQIADALDAAHSAGLVHRDVKPGNVLMTPVHDNTEHVYLTDFGLTKRMTSLTGGLTGAGNFLGTIDYVAPEQIAAKPVGPQTDIYALGCVLYEALTGKLPFERDDDAALLWAHLVESPPPVTALRPELPANVDVVVARAMAKAPEERYESCRKLVGDLQAALAGTPVATAARHDSGRRSAFLETPAPEAGADVAARPGGRPQDPDAWTAAPPEPPPTSAGSQHPSFPPGSYDPRGGGAPTGAAPPEEPAQYEIPRQPEAGEAADDYAPDDTYYEEAEPAARRRPWLAVGVAAAALVGVIIAVTGYFLLSGGDKLSAHYARSVVVPMSFDYPSGWQKQESGVDVVFSPRADAIGQLFAERGAGDSWAATRIVLNQDPSQALGLYTSLSATAIDTSSAEGLATLRSLLPEGARLQATQRDVLVGGFASRELVGRLVDPASGAELSTVTYVVQAQEAVDGTMQLTFFSAPSELSENRDLFDQILRTVNFAR